MTDSELRMVQMDILSAVDRMCRENSIKYSIVDGTLLGAVRHGGYIPWDDDIDIMMTRDEYGRFEKSFPDVLEGHYRMASLDRDPGWYNAYPIIYDDRTLLEPDAAVKSFGVSIDLFIIDEVPDDRREWLSYRRKLKTVYSLLSLKKQRWSSRRGLLKNIAIVLLKLPLLPFPLRKLALLQDKMALKFRGRGFKSGYESCFGVYGKDPFDIRILQDIVDMPFEDRKYMAVRDYDNFLSNNYGDYMTLPPESERVAHHSCEAWWL